MRHADRAAETLREADRLLRGAVKDAIERAIKAIGEELSNVEREESRAVQYRLDRLPMHLVPYLDNPFAQSLAFNRFCAEQGLSHTRGAKQWGGGNAAVSARNLLFLPPVFADLWEEGQLDKTRLVAIANRNLSDEAYAEMSDMVRTRRKEDLDERLLKMPAAYLRAGRRGPEQALEAAVSNGWLARFAEVEIPEELVQEAQSDLDQMGADEPEDLTPAVQALQALRAGLAGAKIDDKVVEVLGQSPDPMVLVERYLTGHRQADEPDPETLTRTSFYSHAGPMQKMEADDKLLLRHFRPVKTQKRGQLFYRLLEVLEEALLERQHLSDLEARGIAHDEGAAAVRREVELLNKDPNRHLVIPDEWLGEVTRRHMYFGSRTRKEGAAYKWFRKIGSTYYLGSHKTEEEVEERDARRAARAEARATAK